MHIFDRYILKSVFIAMLFIALTLSVIIFLTQSLRFLELVIESGASGGAFWSLTMMALPRFFEVILPLALFAATLFVFNRMEMDSEIAVARSVGYAPFQIARPVLTLALLVTIFLWVMTLYVAPRAQSGMEQLRVAIKAQLSSVLFREGVFNQIGQGLTVYIRDRVGDAEMRGLMIHDRRDPQRPATTILAKSGIIVSGPSGQEVVVYDGSRQDINPASGVLRRLDFERYTIDLPDGNPARVRWKEPNERTIFELLTPDLNEARDRDNLRNFSNEIHRRAAGPLLTLAFALIACAALLLGPADRRGQGRRIAAATVCVMILQGLFMAASNLARQSDLGLPLMYATVLLPLGAASILLLGSGGIVAARIKGAA